MKQGYTVWFTGLSGAGKTTLNYAVGARLTQKGIPFESLDGDEVRTNLCWDLGFTRTDRNENIRRIGYVAGLLSKHGVIALVSAISPYRTARELIRRASKTSFIEVFVNAPLAVCEQRDVKGLYAKVRRGELSAFTGICDPYEPPENPEIECCTDRETIDESVDKIMQYLERQL
jgi:adenylylsulfate kinase